MRKKLLVLVGKNFLLCFICFQLFNVVRFFLHELVIEYFYFDVFLYIVFLLILLYIGYNFRKKGVHIINQEKEKIDSGNIKRSGWF